MKKIQNVLIGILVLVFVLTGFISTKAAGFESEVDQAIYVDSYNKSLSISNYFPIAQNFMPNKDVTTGFAVYIKFGNFNNLKYSISDSGARYVASGTKQVGNTAGWEYFSLPNDAKLIKGADYTLYLRTDYSPMAWTYTELNLYKRGYAIKEGKGWLEGDFGLITYGYDQNSNPDSDNSSSDPNSSSAPSSASEEKTGNETSGDTNSSSTITNNNSENTKENSQNKDTAAPQQPKNLSLSENNGMLILKWDKNIEEDMNYYLLTVFLENGASPVFTKKIDKEENAYIISGLDLSQNYIIELQAVDQSGNASGSQKLSWQKQIAKKENVYLPWIIFGVSLIAAIIILVLMYRHSRKKKK